MPNTITRGEGIFGRITTQTLNVGGRDLPLGFRKAFYLDPAAGSDGNSGFAWNKAKATLSAGYALLTTGKNDVLFLIGNGQATGSARLSAGFTWAKDACHLVGVCAPTMVSQRARIAPTAATAFFANMITVTGDGCIFANLQIWHGFDTGANLGICWTDTGERNYYENVHFAGMGDQETADGAGSRALKIGASGRGEHTFVDCVIGVDTVTRGAANASLELTGATPRSTFRNCVFPIMADAATPTAIILSAASAVDRWNLFDHCHFLNMVGSGSTTLTGTVKAAASPGGFLQFSRCTRVGMTDWGIDATSLLAVYCDGPGTGATDDIGRGAVAIAS